MKWNKPASKLSLNKTIKALKDTGINAIVVASGKEAKKEVLKLIPGDSEVMQMTSVSLDTTGISKELNESGKYISTRNKLLKLDRTKDYLKMQQLGAAPDWTVGSVHAVTEDGKVVIASNTGSQLPAYAAGAAHVIFVVGTQKIVKNLDDAMIRIYDYVLPLESIRARKAYGLPDTFDSFVSKLLIINREVKPDRITIIFVTEELGF